nr:probable LRR receptor-like serine/threonine-protein kinase IRK [Tanacetum cinerariifolium]
MCPNSSSSASSLQAFVRPNVHYNFSSSSSSSRLQSLQSQPTVHELALHQYSSLNSFLNHDQDLLSKIEINLADLTSAKIQHTSRRKSRHVLSTMLSVKRRIVKYRKWKIKDLQMILIRFTSVIKRMTTHISKKQTKEMMVIANREISSKVKELVGPEVIVEDAMVAKIAREQVEIQGLQMKNMKQKLDEGYGMLKLLPAFPDLGNVASTSAPAGVRCNPRSNRVSDLVLDGFGLSGKMGRGLMQLKFFNKFSLANTNLTGGIEVNLGQLTDLRFIDLSENSLRGSVPSGFFDQCGSLRSISLAGNKFMGQVMDSLGKCSSFGTFNVSGNQFSRVLPSGVWSLNGLRVLDVLDNLLEGEVPKEIGGLYNLRDIRLRNN